MTSERLHPDGLPVSATPWTEARDLEESNCSWGFVYEQEERAREAEARVAELEREVTWLRDASRVLEGIDETAMETRLERMDAMTVCQVLCNAFRWHLASKPPEGWKP